jgi:hypothetical protein
MSIDSSRFKEETAAGERLTRLTRGGINQQAAAIARAAKEPVSEKWR